MGAFLGALIGQKYADKIRKDKFEAKMIEPQVMDYLTNPKTSIDDEYGQFLIEQASKHMSTDAKTKWDEVVQKSRQYKTAHRAAEQAQQINNSVTARPDSMPAATAPSSSGGLMPPAPDGAQGAAGPMSQGPMPPTGVGGLASMLAAQSAQKKTSDLAAAPQVAIPAITPGVPINPQASNPGPNSPIPSPGFNSVAPANTPDVAPANYFQRSPSAVGRAAAALEMPLREGEYQAQNKATLEREKALAKFRLEENEALMNRMGGKGGHTYTQLGPNGLSMLVDPGVLSNRPVSGKDLLESNPGMADKFGKPISEGKFYDVRSFPRSGGDVEAATTSIAPAKVLETDPNNPAIRHWVWRDRNGVELRRDMATPNAAFSPQVNSTNSNRTVIQQIGGQAVPIQLPNSSTTTRQRVMPSLIPGAPGSDLPAPLPAGSQPPAAPMNAPGAPTAPAMAAPRTTAGGVRVGTPLGSRGLAPAQALAMTNALTAATNQIFGDYRDPSLKPLSAYADLANDKGSNKRLGTAFRLALDAENAQGGAHLGAVAGPISLSAGGIGDWLQNSLGITAKAAEAQAATLHDAVASLTPSEQEYFHKMMNVIPTVSGYRKITSNGAFKWSQDALERELPFIGLSTTNADSYRQKIRSLGNEPLTAMQNFNQTNPGAIDPRMMDVIRKATEATGMTAPAPAGIPNINTQAEFDALPKGAIYMDNGQKLRKP